MVTRARSMVEVYTMGLGLVGRVELYLIDDKNQLDESDCGNNGGIQDEIPAIIQVSHGDLESP